MNAGLNKSVHVRQCLVVKQCGYLINGIDDEYGKSKILYWTIDSP